MGETVVWREVADDRVGEGEGTFTGSVSVIRRREWTTQMPWRRQWVLAVMVGISLSGVPMIRWVAKVVGEHGEVYEVLDSGVLMEPLRQDARWGPSIIIESFRPSHALWHAPFGERLRRSPG